MNPALFTAQTPRLKTPPRLLVALEHDLHRMEARLLEAINIAPPGLTDRLRALVTAGGKRMRPRLTLLAARLFGADPTRALPVAAGLELLHTATLIHDDLVDHAQARRGVPTLNTGLPMGLVVLSGDLLFAQAAALVAEADLVNVVRSFARALTEIVNGELLQAASKRTLATFEEYYDRIYGKTASLFRTAAETGAMIGSDDPAQIEALGEYGRLLGMAFQIVDDALDFTASPERLGKPSGHDLREGIISLPVLIYHQQRGDRLNGAFRQVIQGKASEDQIAAIVEEIRHSGAVEAALDVARDFAAQAQAALDPAPDGPARDDLLAIAEFAVARDH